MKFVSGTQRSAEYTEMIKAVCIKGLSDLCATPCTLRLNRFEQING